MSFEAAAWAIKTRTKTATDKLILIVLADCHNRESGACFPSYAFLAIHAQCSERQVGRSIRSLEGAGLVIVQREQGKSNNYCLRINTHDNMSYVDNMSALPPTICPVTPDTMSYKPGTNQEVKPTLSQNIINMEWAISQDDLFDISEAAMVPEKFIVDRCIPGFIGHNLNKPLENPLGELLKWVNRQKDYQSSFN